MSDLLDQAAMQHQCKRGQTALYRVAWSGSAIVVERLLNKQDESIARMKDKDNNTALHIAAKEEYEAVVKVLTGYGSLIDDKGWNDLTPLHYAVMNGHENVVRLPVEKGAKGDAVDCIGWTPLHYAVWYRDDPVAKYLIDNGLRVNTRDAHIGWTPLHMAAMSGDEGMVKLLLQKGAEPRQEDNLGLVPRQLRIDQGVQERS